MATVSGVIRTETGGPALNATVQAFDKDLRHEQLLGAVVITETTGRYQITYTADQFRRAEKKTADLFVRVLDRGGNRRVESEILFNARDEERIDLTFAPLPVVETPRLSELERLQESIESVREEVAYLDFTVQDLALLTEEAIRAGSLGASERRTVRQHLEFLRLADQFAHQTDIPLPAFYGWFRQDQPQVLEALLDVPARTLRAALAAAIRGNIIPDITAQIPEILERVGALRFEHGRLVHHRFVVQLINAETNRPLVGYSVEVNDPAAEPEIRQIGTLVTDGRGACVIILSLPGDAPASATRRLQLRISDQGVDVAEATIDARANQEEVATLRVRLRDSESGDVPIEASAPAALAVRLRERGIATLHDVLAHPELVDQDDPEGLERLRATAKFAILAPDLEAAGRDRLLNLGYRSLVDVGAASRAQFVRDEGAGGDAVAYATHFAARETGKVLYHMIGSAWLKNVTTPGDDPDPDIPTGVNDVLGGLVKCGCRDCDSAVSPAAYLAHLLQWTLEHIKDGTASISFGQMEAEFHQRFGDLPASCAAVEDEVRQVRICVETLWRYTDFLDQEDLQLPTSFRTAYRHLRNQLYHAILTHLGASFEQLRKATLQVQGDNLTAELVAAERHTVSDVLGIDETHLNALFFNIEQPPVSPSEEELQQRFGFKNTRADNVFASTGTPDLVTWQRERLESIWQQQDWLTDAYSGEARLPFVDPALIDEAYLRTPLEENAAFALLEARREALAAHRQALIDQAPQQNGLVQLLESELEQGIDQLRSLYATLQTGGQPEEIAEAHQAVDAVHLTLAGFVHLMGIDARFVAGEPVGATTQEIEAAWESMFDILSGAHRRGLFAAWVEEENDLGLIFGPKLFWSPVEPSDSANPWQAAPAEREDWQEALDRRSARPIIDPDQIPANYVIFIMFFAGLNSQGGELGFVTPQPQPPLTAMALWQQRRAWIDGRLAAVSAARQNQGNALATFEAALSASTVGVGLDAFAELANMDAEGRELGPRLSQLNLTTREYRFLAGIRELAQGNATITSDMWEEVDANLVQIEKRHEFAEWQLAEQVAEITLHPNRFVVPKDPAPVDDSAQLRWLHDPIALQQWVTLLQARADQLRALREGLDHAVSNAEEAVLPLLRNILIMQTVADGDSLLEKAEWLDKRLLVDMRMDGCQMTTRVSQAIETLQRFIRGVYTQEHLPLMEHLTLDAEEDYELEWPVLGSYATWRAFMLAYLFPENLLHLSPPSRQSFGFAQLKNNLGSRIEPKDACAAAEAYSQYFQDVFHLEVQASCQVRARVDSKQGCRATTAAYRSRVHVFAVATTSRKVYTNVFDGYAGSEDTLDTWRPVPELADVLEIIGAVPHETPAQKRLVLLFVKVRESSKTRLKFVVFDLDTNSWSDAKPKELDSPPGAENDFSAVAVQKRHGSVADTLGLAPSGGSLSNKSVPTILAIRAPDGRVYVGYLNDQATDWAGGEWTPLFGDIKAQKYKKVCALIQRNRHEYMMIIRDDNDWLRYRIFSIEPVISRDDGFWREIARGEFSGAFTWPGATDVYVFYQVAGKTHTAIVGPAVDFIADLSQNSIGNLNGWLENVAGVSLRHFKLSFSMQIILQKLNPDFDPDQPFEDGISNPPTLTELGLDHYEGNLFDLLTQEASSIAMPGYATSEADLLLQRQEVGLNIFKDKLQLVGSASFRDPDLGQWKLADWYVRQFADGKAFASAVEETHNGTATEFRFRGVTESELVEEQSPTDRWHFVSSAGDEELQPPRKAIVVRTPDGAFRLKLQRSGDVLSAPKLSRITPMGDGPFDLAPVVAKQDLQLRGEEIRMIYQGADAQSSLRIYLKEAYNLVPIFLGYQLQRNRYYEEALLWYRQVYDYLHSADKRRIDYGLKLEQVLGLSYEDAEEWLDDASNAHAIAATRKNTYTRHILLMIIRCLIEYADALFSRDNVTDNTRARELYTMALALLDLNVLKSGFSECANIIGQLEIEVVEPGIFPIQQFKVALAEIPDPDRLRSVVTALTAINQDTSRSAIERLADMRESVLAAVNEIPAAPGMMSVLATKRQTVATIENQFLSNQSSLMLMSKTHQHARQATLTSLAEITDSQEDALLEATAQLPWLRLARPEERDDALDERPELTLLNPNGSRRLAVLSQIKTALPMASLVSAHSSSFAISTGISFDFCIPQNPVIQALRTRAENNLSKLRSCRNIAGFLRELDPYGAPIGIGSGMVSPDGTIFSGIVDAPPTPYRYLSLISRAKELVSISQQIEASYQAVLENAEREAMTLLQAEQSVELAGARVSLQDLRVTQANNELGLAQLQKSSAVLREGTYAGWIAGGKNEHEEDLLKAYRDAGEAQQAANAAKTVVQVAGYTAGVIEAWDVAKNRFRAPALAALSLVQAAAAAAEGVAAGFAINAETRAKVASFEADLERRNNEWRLQQGLAALDVQIGDQQIVLAQNQIDIVQQERVIAWMEQTHAVDILNFLLGKTFDEEMYRWVASVLEDVYRFFLQEATVISRLAERQLAFERQQGPLKIIQSDYWSVAAGPAASGSVGDNVDRLGLTGSARLLRDIYQLDNYAFETRQRKQALSITLDLAEMFPLEFQRFRETGVLIFNTPQSLIDRQMPGYYLCLVQQVSVSLVALIPPTYGIRATLTSAGISRVVVGGDTFQTITIRNLPERLALTGATTTSGAIALEPDSQLLLNPFEGGGFDTLWELRMPKASNPFDYNSMATVLFTVSMTALHSFDYEREVIQRLDRKVSFDRAFDFRQVFPDPWYDLNNPDQTATPMAVRFSTRRSDFPPNLSKLSIQHVVLYLVRKDGEVFEQPIRHLHFTADGTNGPVGGPASTVNGRVSTRSGNGANWLPFIGQPPTGEWELAFPDDPPSDTEARTRFTSESIENILLVISLSGQTPAFPY